MKLTIVLILFSCAVTAQRGYSEAGAMVYVRAQNWNGLLDYTKAWTEAEPNNPIAWKYLAQTYGIGLKQQEHAERAFRRALQLKPDWAEVWHALGIVQTQLKEYSQAVESLHRAVELSPENANYWNNLSAALSYTDNWNAAREALRTEQKLLMAGGRQGAVPQLWYNLGERLFQLPAVWRCTRRLSAVPAHESELRVGLE